MNVNGLARACFISILASSVVGCGGADTTSSGSGGAGSGVGGHGGATGDSGSGGGDTSTGPSGSTGSGGSTSTTGSGGGGSSGSGGAGPAGIQASFFGIGMNSQTSAWPPSSPAGASAAKALRLWDSGVHWSQIETCDASKSQGHQAGDPNNPCYDWSHLDTWISRAEAAGMDVIYTLGATPDWAADQSVPPPACANYNDYACVAPKDVKADGTGTDASLIAFLTAIATRYTGKIAYYEGWNEPDSKNFYSGTTAAFARMMKDVQATVKGVDPAALVLSPSFHGPTAATWFDDFLGSGGADWFDIVNFHGRGQGDANIQPESFLTVFGQAEPVLAAHGLTGRPFWDDEAGYLKDQVLDLDEQEAYVARSYLLRAGVGIGRFYWYQWDSKGGYALQGEPAGDGLTGVAAWIVGNTVSPCSATGTVYTCAIADGGAGEQAIWDTSKSCSNGSCPTTMKTVDASFGHYRDLAGAAHAITNHSAPIGAKPILLQP
jgi:hypothetical protein